jgi:phenylpropionate dioxygenase-like ring-hydroxylating dioxygenase large terminal subunit
LTWHIVAHRCELATPGDFVVLRRDGLMQPEDLAVTNIAGEILAFDNRCPHRGARIFDGLSGNQPPRCAYHGRLVTGDNVVRYPTFLLGDWLLVSKGRPEAPPGLDIDFPRAAPPLQLHSSLTFVMDCHWTVAVENALDFEHVAHVHQHSLAALELEPKRLMTFPDGSSIEEFVSKRRRLGSLSKFFPREQPFDYVHAHLAPYTCLSSTRGWTYSLQHYLPRADGRTTFVHRLYTAPTTRPMDEFFASVARMNEQTFREDAEICARVPAGHRGALAPRERRIAHFRATQQE